MWWLSTRKGHNPSHQSWSRQSHIPGGWKEACTLSRYVGTWWWKNFRLDISFAHWHFRRQFGSSFRRKMAGRLSDVHVSRQKPKYVCFSNRYLNSRATWQGVRPVPGANGTSSLFQLSYCLARYSENAMLTPRFFRTQTQRVSGRYFQDKGAWRRLPFQDDRKELLWLRRRLHCCCEGWGSSKGHTAKDNGCQGVASWRRWWRKVHVIEYLALALALGVYITCYHLISKKMIKQGTDDAIALCSILGPVSFLPQ